MIKNIALRECSDLYTHDEHTRQELMRTLSIRLSFLRACLASASVFPFFKCSFCIPWAYAWGLMRALSRRVRNCCVHWAYASRTDVCADRRVRNWCMHWAYASGTDACTDIRVRNWCVQWAYASGTDACTEHTRQEIMRTLSIRIRNWCVHRHTRQKLMYALSIRIRNWCVHWAYASGIATIKCINSILIHIEKREEKYNTAFDFLSGIIQLARHRRGSLCSHHIGNLSDMIHHLLPGEIGDLPSSILAQHFLTQISFDLWAHSMIEKSPRNIISQRQSGKSSLLSIGWAILADFLVGWAFPDCTEHHTSGALKCIYSKSDIQTILAVRTKYPRRQFLRWV